MFLAELQELVRSKLRWPMRVAHGGSRFASGTDRAYWVLIAPKRKPRRCDWWGTSLEKAWREPAAMSPSHAGAYSRKQENATSMLKADDLRALGNLRPRKRSRHYEIDAYGNSGGDSPAKLDYARNEQKMLPPQPCRRCRRVDALLIPIASREVNPDALAAYGENGRTATPSFVVRRQAMGPALKAGPTDDR